MGKSKYLIIVLLLFAKFIFAQSDYIYVMKNGLVVKKYHIYSELDSIVFTAPLSLLGEPLIDDRDGNVYQTVKIGNQIWMAENLKYLPTVMDLKTYSLTIPCYYVNSFRYNDLARAKLTYEYKTFGVLYNWPAAMDNSLSSSTNPSEVRGVCPVGWHLPSDAEWTTLSDYLGGEAVAGGKLKTSGTFEAGTSLWSSPNTGATNETGFSALPTGSYDVYGFNTSFSRGDVNWWTTTSFNTTYAWLRTISPFYGELQRLNLSKKLGFSVRCIKN
jgi:uncharacterized protein (TIGR02145 family)